MAKISHSAMLQIKFAFAGKRRIAPNKNLNINLCQLLETKRSINIIRMSSKNQWDDSDHDSEDIDGVPDNWDDSSSDSEPSLSDNASMSNNAAAVAAATIQTKICNIDRPVHWVKYGREFRKLRKLPAVIQDPRVVRVYIEQKPLPKTKAIKKGSKSKGGPELRPPSVDKRFDNWQIRMAKSLINGDNVILDVATSCGKTWAVRNIVAEIVLRDNSTAIFVTPNYEILQENIRAILMDNRKTYQHIGHTVGGLQTKKLSNKKDDQPLSCQVLCMTADNVSDFMTASVNEDFVKRLKFIVLDEVHTEDVNNALWRLALMPKEIQFVLLSATIGNTNWLENELYVFRPNHRVTVVQWHVRPISLQRALFPKTMELFLDGARVFNSFNGDNTAKELKERFSSKNSPLWCPNLIDPTGKDISEITKLMGDQNKIQEGLTRQQEYEHGRKLVSDLGSSPCGKQDFSAFIDTQIQNAMSFGDIEDNVSAVLACLQTIHSLGLGPGLLFNGDPTKVVGIAKKLLIFIRNLEHEDKDVREQMKKIDKAEKEAKRNRDADVTLRSESEIAKLQMRKEHREKDGRHSNERGGTGSSDAGRKLDAAISNSKIVEIPCAPDKWRFSRFSEDIPYKTPGWIADLLHYGIGVYTVFMSRWLKEFMFDWFEKRKLAFIICDKSLSLGINLPVRSVILTGNVDRTLFEQMGGRAGRRGLDTEGYVFLATSKACMQKILHDEVQIREIQPMPDLSMIDILRWHKETGTTDKKAISAYIKRYKEIVSLTDSQCSEIAASKPKEKKERRDGDFVEDDFDMFGPPKNNNKKVQKTAIVDEDDFFGPVATVSSVKKTETETENGTDEPKHKELLETYEKRLRWLQETGWLKSKFGNLALKLDDVESMLLLHLIRKGKIDTMFIHALDFSKGFDEVVSPLLTLLCYLWEPRPLLNVGVTADSINENANFADFLPSANNADKGYQCLALLDSNLQKELKELSHIFGINIPFNEKCSDYIIRFIRYKELDGDLRESVSRFQYRLESLLSGVKKMTSGSMSETEPIITLLSRIEKELRSAISDDDEERAMLAKQKSDFSAPETF
jgi:hypothetical protein